MENKKVFETIDGNEAAEVGSQPCRSVSQGVECYSCLPKTAWPPTYEEIGIINNYKYQIQNSVIRR